MSHQSAIFQIDALAAVGSDDCEILLHASHIQSVGQDIFKVIVEGLQRKDCFCTGLTASHERAAVHAEDGRICHDTTVLVPRDGKVRYARRCDRQAAGNAEVRQFDMRKLQLTCGKETAYPIQRTLDRILSGLYRCRDSGLDAVPHRGRGGLDAIEHGGDGRFHAVEYSADLGLDSIYHSRDGTLDAVPYRSGRGFDGVEHGGDGGLYRVDYCGYLGADSRPYCGEHILDSGEHGGNHTGNRIDDRGDSIFYRIPYGSDGLLTVLPDEAERKRDDVKGRFKDGAEEHDAGLHHIFDGLPHTGEEAGDSVPDVREEGGNGSPKLTPAGAEPAKEYISDTAQGVQDIGEGVLDEVPDGTEDFLHARPCLRPVSGKDADKDIEQAGYDIQHHR